MLNLKTADLNDPRNPAADLLNARLMLDTLLSDPGDADPVALVDSAIEQLQVARLKFTEALPESCPENADL
ncbi:MAG: hypothetical protein KDI88_09640 [Gammaproteobacteria bacterium]|nr:hypothetical protein [Gammaproteobacteria bacterium]